MIHAVLICFNNPDQTITRYTRDVEPALKLAGETFGLKTAVTIIDNSMSESHMIMDVMSLADNGDYIWLNGQNLQYGPSINLAVHRCDAPQSAFVLYACTRHGRLLDPTWAIDLIKPMIDDVSVGMTGHLMGSNSPEGVAHYGGAGKEWVKDRYRFVDDAGNGYVSQHVQGGVFACRTELLLRHPYSEDYPHLYSDNVQTWACLKAGYKIVDVPSVRSVWRDRWPENKMTGVKYLHDESCV